MKIFLLLLCVFTFPLTVLFSIILFGGFSKDLFKHELSKSGVYKQIAHYVQDLSFEQDDQMSAQFTDVLKTRFTDSYIQTKTEDALDISTDWVSGKSTTPPVISFRELKEDILAQYPQLLPELEEVVREAKQQATENGTDQQQTVDMMQGLDSISMLSKSDFTIPLTTYLAPVKQLYTLLQILVAVFGVLMIIYGIFLLILTHPWHARCTWLGATFMIGGIWGFLIIFMLVYLVYLLTALTSSNANDIVSIFSPILITMISFFVTIYSYYLGLVSVTAFLLAAMCFGISSLTNPQISTASKKSEVIKKK